jgi:hypothetical protein
MAFIKHTLFMVRGTGSRGFQQLLGTEAIETAGHYENGVGRRLDPDVWDIVDVGYPGDAMTIQSFLQMDQTATQGFDNLKALIEQLPPGRKFAMAGTSQGAIVVSRIYEEIRGGSLADRDEDLLAAVVFGNPRRYPGWSIPGGSSPGGANSRGAYGSDIMAQPDSRWWDFVNTGDIVADCPFNTNAGRAQERVFDFLQQDYSGLIDFIEEIVEQFDAGLFQGLALALEDIEDLASLLFQAMLMAAAVPLAQDPVLNNSPHVQYHWTYTNLPGNTTASAVDLAVNYLTEVGEAALPPAPILSRQRNEIRSLRQALKGDGYEAISEASMVVSRRASEAPEIVVTVYDKFWRPIAEAGDYIELTASKPRNKIPVLMMTLKGSDPLVPIMRNCRNEVIGITVETGSIRWAYTVEEASMKLDDGQRTLQIKAHGLFDYLSYLLIWPNFLLPIQTQIPNRAVFVGPIVSVINVMIAEQAFRLQSGLWELLNNAASLNFDWRAWFGTVLQSRGNFFDMLHTPLYVCHVNPLTDGSPLVAITSRMETVATVLDKLITGYGVTVEVELWLPGDPQPDSAARLSVPTYVVRVTDRSNVTGPTGTIVDSVIKQLVTLEGSVFGNALEPFLNPDGVYAPDGVFIAPTVGVDYVTPWTILIDHPRGPLERFEIVDHHPQGWQIVIGGRSPKWLNDLINATTSWILDSLMIVLGLTGVPSNLLDGLFNDVLLSFQLTQNFERRNNMGPYGKPEKFVATGAAPYNIDALFSFITAMWDSRGYRSAIAHFRNGYPYAVGRDIFPGAMMSIAESGVLYTDYIESIIITDNRQERAKVIVQIGDGQAEEAPIARFQRLITGIQETINVLTLAPQ